MKGKVKIEVDEDYNRFVVRFYKWHWWYWRFEGEEQFIKENHSDPQKAALDCIVSCLPVLRDYETKIIMPL